MKRLGHGLLWVLAALCAVASPAHAEWQNFLASRDGLAHNDVLSILEERGGALWFGTAGGGASRYDGIRWSTVRDSLLDARVQAICQDLTGALWFGTQQKGAARFDGARWQRFLPDEQVTAILADHSGDVWLGTPGGIARYQLADSTWTTYSTSLVLHTVLSITEDSSHNLWVGTAGGVSWLDSARRHWQTFPDPNPLSSDSVLAVAEDRRGSLWFGTIRGAFRYAGAQWRQFTSDSGLASDTVTRIVHDRSGGVWFGGARGVTHFDGEVWEAFSRTADGEDLGIVDAMDLDREGNLWIGTRNRGLYRYDGIAWHIFSGSGGTCICPSNNSPSAPVDYTLGSNCVVPLVQAQPQLGAALPQVMLQDHRGDLWFATRCGGASRLSRSGRWPTGWAPLRRSPAVPISDLLQTLFEDREGNLWFGSAGAGLARLDSTRALWQAFTRAESLASDTVFTIYQDRGGDLWVGTASGVSRLRYDGAEWRSSLTGPDMINVYQIVEDSEGNLWFGSKSGMFRLDPSRTTWGKFGVAQGLASDTVTVLRISQDGRVWVGSPRGLSVYDGTQWAVFASFGVGSGANVLAMIEDHARRIWVGLGTGAARYENESSEWTYYSYPLVNGPVTSLFEDDLHTVWLATPIGLRRFRDIGSEADPRDERAWRTYSTSDGLASNNVTGFLQDRQGRLWFASKSGLTQHDPDRVGPQTIFLSSPPSSVTPSRNASIVFGAAYGEAADVEFSPCWDRDSCAWSDSTTSAVADLPDGRHTFAVRARDWSHNIDPTPAEFTFEVDATPPGAVLVAPARPVAGVLEIQGTAADPRFREYRLEARNAGRTQWTVIDSSTIQVTDGVLARWDTRNVSDGRYDLRLRVQDSLGLVGSSQVTVIVDNQPPYADVTAPARVNAAAGGDIFTTNAEVHLYFPPHAFERDDSVYVVEADTSAVTASSPPPGRLTPAFDVSWSAPRLEKPATLDIAVPDQGEGAGGRSPAIYVDHGDKVWARLGGTLDRKSMRVSATLTAPGRYALFADSGQPGGSGEISGLLLTPRVFSPTGSFASPSVAISFNLPRATSPTVTVYNRAGRRVREVQSGVHLGPGANLVRWDGRDGDGKLVEDGIYVVTVEALGKVATRTVGVVH